MFCLLPCAASNRPEQQQALRGRGLWAVYPAPVGPALAGSGSGWGGDCGGEEGPDNKGYIQGLHWSWERRMESYSLLEPSSLGRAARGLIRKCSLPASGAGMEPCAHRTELPLWRWLGVPLPLRCEQELSMGHFCRLSIPSQLAAPTSPCPPTPHCLGLIGGKEKHKTK